MVHRFADNLMMAARCNNGAGDPTVITTDPVALSGSDRAALVLSVHYFLPPGTSVAKIAVLLEKSIDGVDFVAAPVPELVILSSATVLILESGGPTVGMFVRAVFTYTPENSGDGGTDLSIVQFDCDAYFDKA